MTNYNHWNELISLSEHEMKKLSQDKDSCFQIYDFMKNHINTCLKNYDYSRLLELLPYFEDSNSHPRFYNNGETMRICFYLHILKRELAHQKTPFISSASNYDEFIQQYTLTLFALRRLEIMLSNESLTQAIQYLTSIPLNIYAARIIVENEYFENYRNIYWNLYSCTKNIWTIPEQIQWLQYLHQKEPETKISLEIAILYLKINNPSSAYDFLLEIPSPPPEIQSLLSSLKEILHNE